MILVKIIVFILVLSVIIVIHELGHFLTAKKYGVLCHEFSVGMGPAIYKKKKGETTFAIRAIPFGGYVSMAGEQFVEDIIKPGDKIGLNIKDNEAYEIVLDDTTVCDVRGRIIKRELYSRHGEPLEIELCLDDSISDENLSSARGVSYAVGEDAFFVEGKTRMQLAPYNRCLESKKLWQRFIIMFAGPFMNMVLAMFIYLLCYIAQGTPMYQSTTIGEVADGYAASDVLEQGDKILKVNGYEIDSWYDYKNQMNACIDNGIIDVVLTINRDGEIIEKTLSANVYVNSIGLSNVITEKSKYYTDPSLVMGAIVGDYGLRYKDSVSDDDPQISTGDIITAINITNYGDTYSADNWQPITSWSDLIIALKDLDVANIYFRYQDVSLEEDGTLVYTERDTYIDEQRVQSYGNEVLDSQNVDKIKIVLGINPRYHHNLFESIKAAFKNFWEDFTLIFNTLKLIIHPSGVRQVGVQNLSGVVGIYSMVGSYLEAGIIALLLFMALLSVNIGVMNLLPIPALDGGRILFIIIEGIIHKPLNRKIEAMINNIMFILLMIFMIYILYNDIMRLI